MPLLLDTGQTEQRPDLWEDATKSAGQEHNTPDTGPNGGRVFLLSDASCFLASPISPTFPHLIQQAFFLLPCLPSPFLLPHVSILHTLLCTNIAGLTDPLGPYQTPKTLWTRVGPGQGCSCEGVGLERSLDGSWAKGNVPRAHLIWELRRKYLRRLFIIKAGWRQEKRDLEQVRVSWGPICASWFSRASADLM